jgi:hypothetical protein
VGTVSHGYKAWRDPIGTERNEPEAEFDAAGSCNVDVNCPAGDGWEDARRGVVQLLSGGFAFCTGSLINTTAGDCRPYVLTAAHCGAGPSTTFRFNYERPACESGTPPVGQTVTGATVLAGFSPSDFALLELSGDLPEEFDTFFNGWHRSFLVSDPSWTIHHPSGDVKKISRNDDPLISGIFWGSNHWRVTDWEMGTTEGGSSGAPLFDSAGHIVGQLHGGNASCTNGNGWDEYGKLTASWSGGGTPATRLLDWLDPTGAGSTVLDGLDATSCRAPRPELVFDGWTLDDTAGNGNGAADPGETVTLRVRLRNDGDLAADGIAGTLSAASAEGSVPEPTALWPAIEPGASALSDLPSFELRLDAEWICGQPLDLNLGLASASPPDSWALAFALPTGLAETNELHSEDVEGALPGWTVETPSGPASWSTSSVRSSSPDRSWHVDDPAVSAETWLRMPTLTAVAAGARLRFEHFVDSEAGRDGGVLEYSVDGTTWLDAGPMMLEGGYNGTIEPAASTPLSGRPAWTGDLGGWQSVVVDLSSVTGSDLSVRWRFASDASMGDEGWYVDDITLVTVTHQCAPLEPGPPGEASVPGGASSPFTLGIVEDGFELEWSAPSSGGTVTDYVLYSVPLDSPADEPACEALLGQATSTTLATLSDSSAFLVVARNAAGEGPYGSDSGGSPRPTAGDPCPTSRSALRPAAREGAPRLSSHPRLPRPPR